MHNDYTSVLEDFKELHSANNNENDDYCSLSSLKSKSSNQLSPEDLAKLWGIGLKTTRRTLQSTTQQCVRTVGQLTRRFRTDEVTESYQPSTADFTSIHYFQRSSQYEVSPVVTSIPTHLDSVNSFLLSLKARHQRHCNPSSL
jgi:hypothetical protein